MRICSVSHDGGKDSGVKGFFIVEFKSLFTIVLLKFKKGTREAYHNHAFNAVTIWLKGSVIEHMLDGSSKKWGAGRIKYTSKNTFHKVESLSDTLALSIRGPWVDKWNEFRNGKLVTLTHGRHVL